MEHLKYESCKSDPDLWMREGVRRDGTRYYEYILLYVDDVLYVNEFPKEVLKQLNHYFPIKSGSIGRPKIYLGTKISQVTLPNGVISWAMSSSQYIQDAVRNVVLNEKIKLELNKLNAKSY